MENKTKTNKPIIGISTNLLKITEKPFLNQERNYVNRGYIDCVVKAGGIPLLLPLLSDTSLLDSLLDLVDGVLMTGGQDVHPSYYKEESHPLLEDTAKNRDECELHILRTAYKQDKPIFGICRGMQLLNVAFGGSLYQDLSLHIPQNDAKRLKHSQNSDADTSSHNVELVTGTNLHKIFGKTSIATNSFHHQAVKDVAPGFIISARSPDGVVESIEKTDSPSTWILGVQWHPETMPLSDPETTKLFSTFIAEASNYRRRR